MTRRNNDECFGLPNSNAVAGLIFGVVIIIWALSILFEWELNIMGIIAIIFGSLIVAGSFYKLKQRKQ